MTTPLRFARTPEPQPAFARFVRGTSLLALSLLLLAPVAWLVGAPDTGPEVTAQRISIELVPAPSEDRASAEEPAPRTRNPAAIRVLGDLRIELPSAGPVLTL